jgi:glutamyl-tRNA reductase
MLETLKIPESAKFSQALLDSDLFQECIVIQTCHRVEIFCVTLETTNGLATKQALRLWSVRTGISLDIIEKAIQIFQGKDALRHLFYLAAGLESVIVGEDQVLGQVRSAWLSAKAEGTTGRFLNRAFMKAISIGKKVRTETRINEGAVSISSAAIDLAKQELGDLASTKALVVGAGEAGALAAKALKSQGVSAITIANRNHEKGQTLAENVSGSIIPFDEVLPEVCRSDLVISAISVKKPLFTEQSLSSFMVNTSSSKSTLIIDISQPRSFEERVGSLPKVYLKTIDDLKKLIEQNLQNREVEAEKSRRIILEELENFANRISLFFAEPLISEMMRKFEEIRLKEISRAIRKMAESDEKKLMILDRFSRELIERVTLDTVLQLRKAAIAGDEELLQVAAQLFKINGKVSFKNAYTQSEYPETTQSI